MSRQRKKPNHRPILAKDTDARLAAIIRRLGGNDRPPADGSYRLPVPPRPRREDLAGQPDLFTGDESG
jgi:hypothetical protein